MTTKHHVHVPRALRHGCYRTHRSSGYGYEGLIELPEVPGRRINVLQNIHNNSRVLWHGISEFLQVPGAGVDVLYVPVSRVYVAPTYRTFESSGYGYKCPTEVAEVLSRAIPG